jgi:murein L,D-transpeptidase YcbB/YkuD
MTTLNEQAVEAAVRVALAAMRQRALANEGAAETAPSVSAFTRDAVTAYFASLAEQGERMVSAREVTELKARCDEWDVAYANLELQSVALIEQARANAIREVAEWLRSQTRWDPRTGRDRAINGWRLAADEIEREFAPTESER